MPVEKKENESSKSSLKWIIGIALAIVLLAGGSYLVYRFWPKKTPEQVQQESEKKAELRRQIKLVQENIAKSKIALEKKKAGQQYEFETLDEPPPEVVISNPDKEAQELQSEKIKTWNEYIRINKEIRNLILQQNQTDWDKQKNGQWMVLTEKLDKDPTVKAKLDQFFTTFYHRYKETKKNTIPVHPGANFKGFDCFYIETKKEFVTEMGRTGQPNNDGGIVQTAPEVIIKDYPIISGLNQLYLLNNGRNPGGAMDRFYDSKPVEGNIKFLDISFEKLIQTIAHEIAHAFQIAKNIREDKAVEIEGKIGFGTISDCMESGEGERDKDYKLVKPKNPELVKEHKQFELEIQKMILDSTEFKEFERWWKATS